LTFVKPFSVAIVSQDEKHTRSDADGKCMREDVFSTAGMPLTVCTWNVPQLAMPLYGVQTMSSTLRWPCVGSRCSESKHL